MPTHDEYREKAESCLSLVEELRDPIERLKLLEIAGGYLVLSRHVSERHEHPDAEHDAESAIPTRLESVTDLSYFSEGEWKWSSQNEA